ncbi:MAG: nickel pincer cofactor biosynthesis protein LarC [Candidatus Rokuibacteriota bacterium]
MARVVYFDCPSGAAGDMILGALVDAGVSLPALREMLMTLPLPGWELTAREVRKGAFRATKVDVEIDRHAHHAHRGLRDILAILESSGLPAAVKADAGRIFTRLAAAEARVHGTTPDAVHFHDVGAVDAIIDITGSVAGLALLGATGVHASALPIGGGLVDGPHGRIPIPGPGTAELLRGYPLVDTGVQGELVTPTGAAILSTLATTPGRMPAMTVSAVGYGAGSRDLPEMPNLLRCLVGESAAVGTRETVAQLETSIDDMSPQLYEPLVERLLEAGALDVVLTPVVMKRSRPGVVLTALCAPGDVERLARICFEESSTIGVRWSVRERLTLPREMVTLATAYGAVPCKVSRLDGRPVTVTPEFAEVRRLAVDKSVPVRAVLEAARAAAVRYLAGPGA